MTFICCRIFSLKLNNILMRINNFSLELETLHFLFITQTNSPREDHPKTDCESVIQKKTTALNCWLLALATC